MYTCHCGVTYYHIRSFPHLQSIASPDEIWVYWNIVWSNDPGAFDLRCGNTCADCGAILPEEE